VYSLRNLSYNIKTRRSTFNRSNGVGGKWPRILQPRIKQVKLSVQMSSTSRWKFLYRVITCEWQAVVGAGGGVGSISPEDSVGFVWEYYSSRVVEMLEMCLCILGWELAVVYVA
jgi:hypothetical protein